jgi:plastocyanin
MQPDEPNQPTGQQLPPAGQPEPPSVDPSMPTNDSPDRQAGPTVVYGPAPGSGGNNKFPVVTGLAVLAVLIAVSSYLAFGTNSKTTAPGSNQVSSASASIISATVPPAVVDITSTGFSPATISVKVGQAVDWTNTDTAPHFVTSDDPRPLTKTTPNPKSNSALDPTTSYDYIFSKAGTYTYHDELNPDFRGTVIVH